jgi:hypothetical protein
VPPEKIQVEMYKKIKDFQNKTKKEQKKLKDLTLKSTVK